MPSATLAHAQIVCCVLPRRQPNRREKRSAERQTKGLRSVGHFICPTAQQKQTTPNEQNIFLSFHIFRSTSCMRSPRTERRRRVWPRVVLALVAALAGAGILEERAHVAEVEKDVREALIRGRGEGEGGEGKELGREGRGGGGRHATTRGEFAPAGDVGRGRGRRHRHDVQHGVRRTTRGPS